VYGGKKGSGRHKVGVGGEHLGRVYGAVREECFLHQMNVGRALPGGVARLNGGGGTQIV